MCADCQRRAVTNPQRVLDCKVPDCRAATESAPRLIDHLSPEALAHFDQVLAGLVAIGIRYRLNPRLVRGLDYYCLTSFEITSTHLGAQNAVGAGGRYDGLVEMLGGPSVPAVGFATAAASTRPALPPLPPVPPPPRVESSQPIPQPCVMPPAQKPIEAAPAKLPVIKALHEEESDTPLGDWQTESKGVVRIAQCGSALCGYTLNASSNDKGEAVLINMKPKTDTRWTGSVYSKDSGDTYYGTADLKGPNTLRVEACAFSRFYCSGNNWIRISAKPMITSRQVEARPRS